MTNKKFKKAAMALALTACVAVTPLAANAECRGSGGRSSDPCPCRSRPGSCRR